MNLTALEEIKQLIDDMYEDLIMYIPETSDLEVYQWRMEQLGLK